MLAYHVKTLSSCVFVRSLFITYLITVSLEKEIIVWKESGKSLEFWIQKSV